MTARHFSSARIYPHSHCLGLLQAWREAYRFNRHTRHRYFTLLEGRPLQAKLRSLDPDGQALLAYAVFSAADIQAPTVRQPRTWLYINPALESKFQSAVETKPVDSGENLIVLIPDNGGVFYRVEAGSNRLVCTNAVQTYVDCAHSGGRGEEAAEAILQQRLKPALVRSPMNAEPKHAGDYSSRQGEAARRVLVDVGQVLASFRDAIVVVGGWVPDLLLPGAEPEHVGRIDVDLALDAAKLEDGRYAELLKLLLDTGRYEKGDQAFQLVTSVNLEDGEAPVRVEVEFLAPADVELKKNHPKLVEGFRVLQFPAFAAAFEHPENTELEGLMISGVPTP